MKIMHICNNLDNFFLDFFSEMIDINPLQRVFYFRAKDRGLPNVSESYIDVRLNYKNWHRFFFFYRSYLVYKDYLQLYPKNNFDIIHAHTLFTNGYIAYLLHKKFNTPYIVAVRGVDIDLFFKFRFYLRPLGIKILKNAEKIIFISPKAKDAFFDKYLSKNDQIILDKKVEIIPNGINNFFLENNNQSYSRIKDDSLKILTVGFISKRKNQLSVAKALAEVENEGIKVKYTIVGKVLDKKVMEQLKRFKFIQFKNYMTKNDLIEEYRNNDLFVMPSIVETFGLTYIEAMSQGLPVIYSKNRGIDGYFEDCQIGYPVTPTNIDEIKEYILKYYNLSIEEKNEMRCHCINNVKSFNWKSIANKYNLLYKDICGGD